MRKSFILIINALFYLKIVTIWFDLQFYGNERAVKIDMQPPSI